MDSSINGTDTSPGKCISPGCGRLINHGALRCDACITTGAPTEHNLSRRHADAKLEFSGNDVDYYIVDIPTPKRLTPYKVECEDLIEALGMTFAEGTILKALFRSCNMREHGHGKRGQDINGVYDGDKIAYYGARVKAQRNKKASK